MSVKVYPIISKTIKAFEKACNNRFLKGVLSKRLNKEQLWKL